MNRVYTICLQLCVLSTLSLVLVSTAPAASQEPSPAAEISGTVMETMSGAGYTYVKLDTAGGPVWVALPEMEVAVDETIAVRPGMEMKNFHSKSFDRTFESIIFSEGLAGTTAANAAEPQPDSAPAEDSFAAAVAAEQQGSGVQPQAQQRSGGSMAAVAPFVETEVEKAAGDNAYTVAELFAKAGELDGKTVRVRGKVVKYNRSIMGRNWVHLQDGTGDPMKNTHDLVFTTTEDISAPDVITMEGTLATDKDFGAGYTYEIIVENSTVVK